MSTGTKTPDPALAERAREIGVRPESLLAAQQRQADRRARRAALDVGTPAERAFRAAHYPNDVPAGRR